MCSSDLNFDSSVLFAQTKPPPRPFPARPASPFPSLSALSPFSFGLAHLKITTPNITLRLVSACFQANHAGGFPRFLAVFVPEHE